MDTPENYYAILGVPILADSDTIKRAYRQLARRFHPDLAGAEGALEMKRINRAYAVLGDPEKRRNYDTIMGGIIDLRAGGFVRPHARPQRVVDNEDLEFSGLNTFSTRGPLQAGPAIQSTLGVISGLSAVHTVHGLLIVAGSLDGKAETWQIVNDHANPAKSFASDPQNPVEALRELRLSAAGTLLAGWNRLRLHIWDTYSGELLWSYPLLPRAVSAPYSLDLTLLLTPEGKPFAQMALPHLAEDVRAPSAWGVRGTDVVRHDLQTTPSWQAEPLTCIEEKLENRHFWAIRTRALARDARTLVTLSCAQVRDEKQHMAIVRRWNLTHQTRGGYFQPQIVSAILVGRCEDCTPPYATTPDASVLAFVYTGKKIRLCDTSTGTYSEFLSGTMGSSSRLAISPDGQWLAVAREDSEVNEGVVDLWSVATGQVAQKFYHPWQVSAIYFAEKHLLVALTDGTIQVWQ
jgi:WD40 repeat protein